MINGKLYIGQHKWDGDGLDPDYLCSSCNPHFWNAVELYGVDNFNKVIIQKCYSDDAMDVMEELWIRVYDSTNPDKGYNLCKKAHSWSYVNENGLSLGFSYINDNKLYTTDQLHAPEAIEKAKATRHANGTDKMDQCHTPEAEQRSLSVRLSNDPSLSNSLNSKDSIAKRISTKLAKYGKSEGNLTSKESLDKGVATRNLPEGYYKSDKLKDQCRTNMSSALSITKRNIKCIFILPDGTYIIRSKNWNAKNKFHAEYVCLLSDCPPELKSKLGLDQPN